MILYTLQSERQTLLRRGIGYLGLSAFCLLFFLIYNQFSHGVHSPYMTYLFLCPLLSGAVPLFLAGLFPDRVLPAAFQQQLYGFGVETLTMASLLRGIFDIAGTASQYQKYLTATGLVLMAAGVVSWIACIFFNRRRIRKEFHEGQKEIINPNFYIK